MGMRLKVNGTPKEVDADTTLAALLDALGIEKDAKGIAVALNDTVIRKADWADKALREGDAIEVIRAVQGG